MDDLASVQERCGNGVKRIGSADEENLAQVNGNIDVVILQTDIIGLKTS